MMTVTQTDDNFFEVSTESDGWVGNVWVCRDGWTAQDFDGDTEGPFETMMGAAQFVVDMRGAMR